MMQRKNTSTVHRAELFLTYFQNQQGGASFVCEISKKNKAVKKSWSLQFFRMYDFRTVLTKILTWLLGSKSLVDSLQLLWDRDK